AAAGATDDAQRGHDLRRLPGQADRALLAHGVGRVGGARRVRDRRACRRVSPALRYRRLIGPAVGRVQPARFMTATPGRRVSPALRLPTPRRADNVVLVRRSVPRRTALSTAMAGAPLDPHHSPSPLPTGMVFPLAFPGRRNTP